MSTASQQKQARPEAPEAASTAEVVPRFTSTAALRPGSWLFFGGLSVFVVVLLSFGALSSAPTRIAYRLLGLAIAGPAIGLYVGFVRRRALSLTETGLHYYDGLRQRTVAKPGAVIKIIEARIGYRWSERNWPVWVFIGRSGECLVSIPRDAWPADRLEQIRRSLEVPLERRPDQLTPRQLQREIRKSVPWAQAHVFSVTVLLIMAISIAITILR